MELIMNTLFTTEWGAIFVGALLFIGLIIYYFENRNPKI